MDAVATPIHGGATDGTQRRSDHRSSTILLGVAAGILMMPTLLLGGIAWANRKRSPPLLILATCALACAPIVAVVQEIPKGRFILAFPAYLLLLATFIPVYARIYSPARKG